MATIENAIKALRGQSELVKVSIFDGMQYKGDKQVIRTPHVKDSVPKLTMGQFQNFICYEYDITRMNDRYYVSRSRVTNDYTYTSYTSFLYKPETTSAELVPLFEQLKALKGI